MSDSVYKGMDWAFTKEAKVAIAELMHLGMKYDLAVATLDEQVRTGRLTEKQVYKLPPNEKKKASVK